MSIFGVYRVPGHLATARFAPYENINPTLQSGRTVVRIPAGQFHKIVPPQSHTQESHTQEERLWAARTEAGHKMIISTVRDNFPFVYRTMASFVLSRLLPLGEGFTKILEVGPGNGIFTAAVPEEYREGWSLLEINPTLAKLAGQHCPRVKVGSMYDPQFAPESFDAVFGLNALDSPRDQKFALEKLVQLLRPGGRMLLCQDVFSSLYQVLTCRLGDTRYDLGVALEHPRPVEDLVEEMGQDLSGFGVRENSKNIYFEENDGGRLLHRASEYHERLVETLPQVGLHVGEGFHGTFELTGNFLAPEGVPFQGGRLNSISHRRGITLVWNEQDVPDGYVKVDYAIEFIAAVKEEA